MCIYIQREPFNARGLKEKNLRKILFQRSTVKSNVLESTKSLFIANTQSWPTRSYPNLINTPINDTILLIGLRVALNRLYSVLDLSRHLVRPLKPANNAERLERWSKLLDAILIDLLNQLAMLNGVMMV